MAYHHLPLYDLLNHTRTAHPACFASFCPRYCCFHTTRSSISHLLRHWPPFLCHPFSRMCAPHQFAWPGLARRWVPCAVAHIHCPGNIVAPRRSPCFKGCCPGYQYRRLSPSRRLGPPEVLLCVAFNSRFLRILLVCVFVFRRLKLHGCADRYIPPCLLVFHLFIRIESWPIIIHYLITRKIHGKQCDKQKV